MSQEEIEKIEEEIKKTPYHKATQKHIGKLKAKIAMLKTKDSSPSGKKGKGYSVKKSGDATVLLVGFPSVGKSTLLNSITRAESKTADYEFTTLDIIPGILEYNSAKIQVLDIPGIIEGVAEGKGRGKEILSVVRNADLILIMTGSDLSSVEIIKKELQNAGFRIDQKKPDVKIEKKNIGGLRIETTKKLSITKDTIRGVLNEFGIYNADVLIREKINEDRLIDSLLRNRVYVKSLVIVNKIDTMSTEEIRKSKSKHKDFIFVSAKNKEGLEELKRFIWKKLELIRVYLKKVGKEPDMRDPLIMRKGSSVLDVAKKIHKEAFGESVKYARIWGPTARFEGQKIGVSHLLKDTDVVELHTK